MTIEIVDFPMKNGDFPVRYVKLPEGSLVEPLDLRVWSTNQRKDYGYIIANRLIVAFWHEGLTKQRPDIPETWN
jgi:hypothetical protein